MGSDWNRNNPVCSRRPWQPRIFVGQFLDGREQLKHRHSLYGWDRAEGCAAKSGGVPSCPNYWYGKRNSHGQYFSLPRRYSSGAWSPECSEPASGDLVCLPERRGLQLRMEHDSLVVQGDISTKQFRLGYVVPSRD